MSCMHAYSQISIHYLLPSCIYYNKLSRVLYARDFFLNLINPWSYLVRSKATRWPTCHPSYMEKIQFCRKSTNSH